LTVTFQNLPVSKKKGDKNAGGVSRKEKIAGHLGNVDHAPGSLLSQRLGMNGKS